MIKSLTAVCDRCGAGWNDDSGPCFNCNANLTFRKPVGNAVAVKVNFLNIPAGSKIKVKTGNGFELLTFLKIDGSCAVLERDDGDRGFLRFYTPLEKIGDHYEPIVLN